MPAISTVTSSGIPYADYVDSGTKWAVNSFTYSFPTSASFYTGLNGASYGSGEENNGFKAFTAVQQAATASILNMYSGVANVTFTQIAETSTQSADLRYAESNLPSTAWGYYPTTSPEGGDAWFNNSSGLYNNPVVGNYAWLTIIHETGHLLGLKHPQDWGPFGNTPASVDSLEYSVMSYRSYIGASTTQGLTNATWSFPTTLMLYDIAALQYMYGANYSTNSGNTVYKWSATTGQETINGVAQAAPGGNTVFMTLWDGGGNDTYDFSNYTTNLSVNLQPGAWTTTSAAQLANLGAGHIAVGDIANAYLYSNNPASLIENAIGGSGNDTIVGNAADNKLTGGAGNDSLDGVSGTDTAVYSGPSSAYQVTQNADGSWTVADLRTGSPDGTDTLKNIEFLQFSDTTVAIGTVPPPPPTVTAPLIGSVLPDSGSVGDGITNANVLTLTGTAPANSTVKIYDGATLLGSAVANTSGAWSFATSALTDGNHGFTATATDGSGNTSAASTVTAVIVDTVAPVTPTISLQSIDSGVAGDGITNVNVISLTGTAEINSTIKVYDGGTLLGSATANAAGVWNFVADLSNDQIAAPVHQATITGVHGAVGRGVPVVLLGTADPDSKVSIYDGATGALVGTTAAGANGSWHFVAKSHATTFMATATDMTTGSATPADATVPNQTQAWGFTTGPMPDGVHNFTVSSTDQAGNTSATSAVLPVSIDTVAPVAPNITSFSSDSGVAGDGITNDNTLTLNGTAEAGSTVKVYDGATLLGSAVASGTGAWSYTTAALANGGHSLTATATDVAGNTGVASTVLSVTIDTVAPIAPAIASFSTDSGVAGDHITNDNALTLNGTAEAGSTVKVYDGATLLGSAIASGTGVWNFTSDALADGAHNLTATATDAAGNTGVASATLAVTIDTSAPIAPIVASFSTDSGVAGDGITNDNTLTLTGTAEAGSTVKVYDGATLLGSAVASGTGVWSYTTAALANGGHSLTATATDAAGNTGVASTVLNVTVDTTAPVAPTIASFSTDSGVAGDHITNDNTLTLTGSAEANSTVKVYDGATLLGSVAADGSGAWSYTTAALTNGVHNLTATVTDVAGNTGVASTALNVTVDTTAPVAPTIASFSTDSGVAGDHITNDNTLTLTGTAEAGSTVSVYDGATLLGSALASGTGAWSYTSAVLTDGAHNLTATATDAAGNTGVASAALSVAIDTSAPVAPTIATFSTDSGVAGDHVTNDNTLTLTGTAEAGSTIKVYDGATLLGSALASGTGAWSYTSAVLTDGAHNLTATATDAAGNTGVASAALPVTIDTTAPVAPTIATFSNDSGVAGDHITNDNTLTLTGTAEAGSTVKVYDGATLLGSASADNSGAWSYTTLALANGGHSVTATATDVAGNAGVASAALAVTIDTTAPVAPTIATFSNDSGVAGDGITNDNTLTLTGTAEANSTVKVYDGATLLGTTAASGTGAWSYTSGALSDGGHNLTATATDAAGNAGVASTVLPVTIDTTAPGVTQAAAVPASGIEFPSDTVIVTLTLSEAVTVAGTPTLALNTGGTATYTGGTGSNALTFSYTVASSDTTVAALTITAVNLLNGAKIIDAAGNSADLSGALTTFTGLQIDPPPAPVAPTIASFSTDSGMAGDGITNDNTLTLTGTAEAGSTVKIYDGAAMLGSVLASGTGAWSYTTAALANGGHSLTATATDTAGVTGVASTALSVSIDTTAPVAPTIASFSTDTGVAGDHITNDNMLTLTGTAEAGSTVKVYDGAALLGSTTTDGSGAWSFTSDSLADGAHSLTTKATDVAGNTGVASATLSVTIDATAPVAPTIASFSTDTGVAGDHITNDNTLTLTGTAEAGSTVKLYDGATLLGSVVASATGAWSYTSAALANGDHNLTATATDVAGNTGDASTALAVTIDTTAPVAPTIASFSTDTGVAGDRITSDNTLTLTGTAEASSTVKVYDGATLLGSAATDGSGAWSYTTGALANGAHNLTATATDVAGNTGIASTAQSVTIDTTAPVAPTISSFTTDTGVAGDHITSDNILTVNGTAEAGSTVNIYEGATLLGSATASGTGAWSFTSDVLTDGAHSLTAKATDAAGNTGVASTALNVTIDTTAPVTPTIASFSNDSGVAGDGITNDSTLTLTGTAEAGSTVKVYDGVTLLGSATASGTGAWSYTTAALANGSHSLTATATDIAGNTGVASAALSVAIDATAPVAPTIISFSTDSGVAGDHITNDSTLTLTGTAEANSTVKVYDGATLLGSAATDGSGAWSYTTGTLANGGHNLTATATDVAGNTGVASTALNVAVDTTAPVAPTIASFSTDSGVAGDHITNDNTLTLTGTAEANSTVKVCDGATLLGSAVASGTGAWTFTSGALTDGSHSLTAAATDIAGNTGVVSAALSVTIDTTAPVAPTIASFSTDSGVAGDGITNDNTLTLTGTAEAGSTVKLYDGATLLGSAVASATGGWSYTTAALANGGHNLTATVTDVAGNTGVSSAALSVIIDATAPVAPTITSFSTDSGVAGDSITNDNALTLAGTAEAGGTVKVYDGAALLGSTTADDSGAWSYTTGALANGAHNLTATATDVAGNTGVASTALKVTVDTTAPVAPTIASFSTDSGVAGDHITNDNTLTLTGTAEAGSTVKVYDGATLLGSATASGTGAWSFTSGALTDGGHGLTAAATDVAGNTGVASTTLNVTIDTTAPVAPTIDSFSTDTGVVGDHVTTDNTFTLTGAAEANSTVKVYDGAALLGTTVANGTGAWSYTTAALANGAHSLTATDTDIAGNTGDGSGALNVTVVPAPAAPSIKSFSTDTGVVGDHITSDNTPILTGTAQAGSTVNIYDGTTLLGSTVASGTGAWGYTADALADGSHSLSATATDAFGDTSVASAALALKIDTTAPASPTSSVAVATGTFAYLAGSAEAGSTVSIFDAASGALVGTAATTATGTWSFMKFGVTAKSFVLTDTDAAGNSSAAPHAPAPAGSPPPASAAVATDNGFVFSDGISTNSNAGPNTNATVTHADSNPFAGAAAAVEASLANAFAHTATAGVDLAIGAEATALQSTLAHLVTSGFHLV